MASSGKPKSKEKDKAQQQAQSSVPASIEPPEREVVMGRLKESDWCHLIECEQSSEVASELVAETVDVVVALLFQHHLDTLVIPYTVMEARKSLLQMVEWYFLSRDEGVANIKDATWTEDKEPVPAVIDSWARGLVFQTPLELVDDPIEVVKPEVPRVADISLSTDDARRGITTLPSKSSHDSRHSVSTSPHTKKTGSRAVSGKTVSRHQRPQAHKPRQAAMQLSPPSTSANQPDAAIVLIPDAELPSHSITPTTSASTCLPRPQGGVKMTQYGGVKEVSYDERGNIIAMIKLDTSQFPSHSVRPKVSLVPSLDVEPEGKIKDQPKMSRSGKKPHSRKVVSLSPGEGRRGDSVATGKESRRFPEIPSLPPLVDTIDPAPGVTIHEGGRTVYGTSMNTPSTLVLSSLSRLRPVHPTDCISVEVPIQGSPLHETSP